MLLQTGIRCQLPFGRRPSHLAAGGEKRVHGLRPTYRLETRPSRAAPAWGDGDRA